MTSLTVAFSDLIERAAERDITIHSFIISEDQAKLLDKELIFEGNGTRPPPRLPPKGSTEPMLVGDIYGVALYVRPDKLTLPQQAAADIKRAINDFGALDQRAVKALNVIADYLEKQ